MSINHNEIRLTNSLIRQAKEDFFISSVKEANGNQKYMWRTLRAALNNNKYNSDIPVAGIPMTLYFLYFPIFPCNLNPTYFSLFFHDFWPKNPIFPYIFSKAAPWSDNLRGFACKGAYNRPQGLTIVSMCVVCVHRKYQNQ